MVPLGGVLYTGIILAYRTTVQTGWVRLRVHPDIPTCKR
jgi:hypothetical protein